MWKLDDTVMYGSAGICRITDIRNENFGGENKLYFVLKPLFDNNNTFFVPSFNEALMSKIKPILTEEEATALLNRIPEIAPVWFDNDRYRQEKHREILDSGDREMIISVLKALYSDREKLFENGKKMRSSDEGFMRNAEQVFENEIAYIFGLSRSDVKNFIDNYGKA